MKINLTQNQYVNTKNVQRKNIKSSPHFKGNIQEIERIINNKGIQTNFKNNLFLAECMQKIVRLFEDLYGKESLPTSIGITPLALDTLGEFDYIADSINFNSFHSRFQNLEALKAGGLEEKGLIINNKSTIHPAHTFIHEFSHCAHKSNIKKQGHDAIFIIEALKNMQVPTAIGRLITKFKLGNYALDKNGGMNEFMAERATQDICNALTDNRWLPWKNSKHFDYSDIFQRKWNCRYTSPQSYLDYFTQQVWNGNIQGAIDGGNKARIYLEEIDRQAQVAAQKQKSFWGVVDLVNAKIGLQARWLDRRNQLGFNATIVKKEM